MEQSRAICLHSYHDHLPNHLFDNCYCKCNSVEKNHEHLSNRKCSCNFYLRVFNEGIPRFFVNVRVPVSLKIVFTIKLFLKQGHLQVLFVIITKAFVALPLQIVL